MNINYKQKKSQILIWSIFLLTLIIVLIHLSSVLFPAYLLGIFGEQPKHPLLKVDPLEVGTNAYPLLATNIGFLVFGILFWKNKLPKSFIKAIKNLLNYDISRKVAFVTVSILIGIYIVVSVAEISQGETWEDYGRIVEPRLKNWTLDKFWSVSGNPLAYFFGYLSMKIFGNYRVIPFMATISLLILTYFISSHLSQKKFSGLVSLSFVLSSTIFLTYDTTITYPNFWILFYILSLFTIYKKWPLSAALFVFSVASKPLPVFFLPMTAYFILRANIPKKKKFLIFVSYMIVIGVGILLVVITNLDLTRIFTFDFQEFLRGFTTIVTQFRFDTLFIVLLLPLVVGLFIITKKKINHGDTILVLILGMLLIAPIIPGFTTYANNPYRFIPLIIFFAIGLGMIFSGKVNQLDEVQTNRP